MRNFFRSIIFLLILFLVFGNPIHTAVLNLHPSFALLPAQQITSISVLNNFGQDPKTERNFTWNTQQSVKNGYIKYCPKDEFQNFSANNIIVTEAYSYPATNDTGIRMIHKVSLKNLKPGTEYVYQIENGMDSVSSQGTFKTAENKPSKFTFIQITDTQGLNEKDYQLWENTLGHALKRFPDAKFLLHTGDMVDNGQEIKQWDLFTNAVVPELMSLPIEPCVGNHEAINTNGTNPNAKNFIDHFNLPTVMDSGAPDGTVYSFDYGYTHIAVLNTECDITDLKKEGNWLETDMKKSGMPWKIVALHRGPYGATYDSTTVRDTLTPIFDKIGIDLVLQGHDHNYVRTYPMNHKAITAAGKGTIYITANSGGVKFYPKKWRFWQAIDLQPYVQMFVAVTVDKNSLKIQAFDINDTLIDKISLTK